MSATFTCPHCGAVYPFKPVLVGRAVRCTTCKNAFSLRADGTAEKVGGAPAPAAPAPAAAPARPATATVKAVPASAAAPARPAAPAPVPAKPRPAAPVAGEGSRSGLAEAAKPAAKAPPKPAPAPAAAAKPAAAPRPAPAPAAADKPAAAEPADDAPQQSAWTRAAERLTNQQKEARRSMAATLSVSMNAALQAESVKKESEAKAQKEKKKALGRGEGGVGKISPALLSGEGVAEAKLVRSWWLYGLGSVAIIGALAWVLGHHGPRAHALDVFTAVVEGKRNRPGERVLAIQERAWLTTMPPANVGVPPITDMSDARIGSAHTVKLAGARPLLETLKGLVLIEPQHLWLPPKDAPQLLSEWTAETKAETFVAALVQKGVRAVEHRALLAKLEAAGLGSDDVVVIDLFLRGRGVGGTTPVLTRWLAGDLPEAMEISPFYGPAGTLIVDQGGQTYKTRTVRYSGQLLRFVGKDWPDDWRVLTLTTGVK